MSGQRSRGESGTKRDGTDYNRDEPGRHLPEEAREKISSEIKECQDRVVRVLVPTIISFGLASVGNMGAQGGVIFSDRIVFGALFAVLFSSSLYIASLSYKIFERAAFLRYFAREEERLEWEEVVQRYREEHSPRFIGSETSAVAWIYTTLAVTFGVLFWDQFDPLVVGGCTLVLLAVAIRIWLLPQRISAKRIEARIENIDD